MDSFLSFANLVSFLSIAFVIIVSPGPDSLLIMDRSARHGAAQGRLVTWGVASGHLAHNVLCVLGLAAIVYQTAVGFMFFKFASAAFLIFLGVKAVLASRAQVHPEDSNSSAALRSVSSVQLFVQGFLSNFLNPKSALFFLAFIPQFVVPADTSLPAYQKLFVVGVVFSLLATFWHLCLSSLAARFGSFLKAGSLPKRLLDAASGGVLTLLGVKVLLERRPA